MDVTRTRLHLVLVVAVLVGGVAVPMASIGTAQSGGVYVTVGNVSVSPENPEPGEQVTVTAEFRNSASSEGAAKITEATLRGAGLERRSSVDNLGDLGPGDSIEVPFTTAFSEVGQQRLTFVLRGHNPSGGVFVVERPVYVDVERSGGVSVAFSTVFDTDPAAGAKTPINVTVANGDDEAITGVRLNLDGDGTVEDPRRVKGSIAAGSETTVQYDVTFDEVGTHTLTETVTYRTSEGVTRTTTESVDVDVFAPETRGGLSARTSTNGSGETTVELTNFGNTEFTDVEVAASVNDDVVARNLVADVEPDSSESVIFDVRSSVDGAVTYTATYTAAGATHTTTLRDQSTVSGEIRLVSVETGQTGSSVTVQGDAANLGSTTAESVLVSVADTDAVSPTAPTGEYYVGEVEGSEFGTFELTATTSGDVSSIPVEITYIVDGDRVTATQEIEIESASSAARGGASGGSNQGAPSGGGPGSGLPLTGIGLALAALLLVGVGVAVYRWRDQ